MHSVFFVHPPQGLHVYITSGPATHQTARVLDYIAQVREKQTFNGTVQNPMRVH